jgi:hypothetical protein
VEGFVAEAVIWTQFVPQQDVIRMHANGGGKRGGSSLFHLLLLRETYRVLDCCFFF